MIQKHIFLISMKLCDDSAWALPVKTKKKKKKKRDPSFCVFPTTVFPNHQKSFCKGESALLWVGPAHFWDKLREGTQHTAVFHSRLCSFWISLYLCWGEWMRCCMWLNSPGDALRHLRATGTQFHPSWWLATSTGQEQGGWWSGLAGPGHHGTTTGCTPQASEGPATTLRPYTHPDCPGAAAVGLLQACCLGRQGGWVREIAAAPWAGDAGQWVSRGDNETESLPGCPSAPSHRDVLNTHVAQQGYTKAPAWSLGPHGAYKHWPEAFLHSAVPAPQLRRWWAWS